MTTVLFNTNSLASAYAFLRDIRPSFEDLDWVLTVRREHDGTFSVIAC